MRGNVSHSDSLEARLERDRLRRRERRLELVMKALRDRVRARDGAGDEIPAPLGHAMADFASELRAVRARLRSTS